MNIAQKVGAKHGVNCLYIMFTRKVMVLKMSKTAHFFF